MKMYANLNDYADHMRQETGSILAGLCRELGPEHDITLRVAGLCTEAATVLNQRQMQQESGDAERYNLTALVVDPETASNSETGWEQED